MTTGRCLRTNGLFQPDATRYLNGVIALCLVSALAACTATSGRDFERPASGSLTIGETTESEVLTRYGKPESTSTEVRDDQTINTLVYSYSSNEEAIVGGATPARTLACQFVNGSLVGYEFISSYPKDHTSFDPTKRKAIQVGKSTKEDVINVMGPPNGERTRPLIDPPAARALVYSYMHTQVSVGFAEVDVHYGLTAVLVLLGADGVVQDIKYTETQT